MKNPIQAVAEAAPIHEAEAPRPLVREIEAGEPFPVDALPPTLESAARVIQARTLTPMAIPGNSVLMAATLATQGFMDVVLPTGQTRPLSNYAVTIAGSGERKTSADAHATEPIRRVVASQEREYSRALGIYQNEKDVYDRARTAILNPRKKATQTTQRAELQDLGPAPTPPLAPGRGLGCDATAEGLQKYLIHNQPSIGLFTSEGGVFVGGHGMNTDNKLRTASTFSLLWDGEAITRIRSGDGVTTLRGKRVSMHLLIQPDVASGLLCDSKLDDQGLLSRMLVAAPASTAGTRFIDEDGADFDTPAETLLAPYYGRMTELLQSPLPIAPDSLNDLEPGRLEMTPAARRMWRQFANKIEKQLGADGPLDPIRGLANKLPEHAARMAGVFTLVENPDAAQVDDLTLARAIRLAEFYAAELLRLRLRGDTDPILALAHRVLAWLTTKWDDPLISLPDLYQHGPNPVRDKRTAASIAGILEDHGWLIRMPDGGVIKGTRRRDCWRIRRGEA